MTLPYIGGGLSQGLPLYLTAFFCDNLTTPQICPPSPANPRQLKALQLSRSCAYIPVVKKNMTKGPFWPLLEGPITCH